MLLFPDVSKLPPLSTCLNHCHLVTRLSWTTLYGGPLGPPSLGSCQFACHPTGSIDNADSQLQPLHRVVGRQMRGISSDRLQERAAVRRATQASGAAKAISPRTLTRSGRDSRHPTEDCLRLCFLHKVRESSSPFTEAPSGTP